MKNGTYLVLTALCVVMGFFFNFALVGYNFLGLCFFALAALIAAFWGLKALKKRHEKAARGLKTALLVVLAVFFLAAAVTEGYIVSKAGGDGAGERYAIVLGAGVNGTVPSLSLHKRLEAALAFAQSEPEAVLILSGGQGPGEDISEARCMFDWLTARGVDPERLRLEERSSSTRENLMFSREILEDMGAEDARVCLITAGYHLARAGLMAEDLGYSEVAPLAAPAAYPFLELNYYLREIPAIWVYLLSR